MGAIELRRENGRITIIGSQQVNLGGWRDNEQGTLQIFGNPETCQEISGDIHQPLREIWGTFSGGRYYVLRFQGVSDLDCFREETYIQGY